MPSAVAAMKPVTTGITPRSSSGPKRAKARGLVSAISGAALWKWSSVTISSVASIACARPPRASSVAAHRRALMRSPSPLIVSMARGVSSPSTETLWHSVLNSAR